MSSSSSQFPTPPELQPLEEGHNVWQIISNILLAFGLVMFVAGVWQFYQYQVALNEPPPAPIVDSVAVLPTLTPPPPATETPPLPTLTAMVRIMDSPRSSSTPLAGATASPVPPTATPRFTVTASMAAAAFPEIDFSLDGYPFETLGQLVVGTPTPQTQAQISRVVAPSIALDAAVVEVGWKSYVRNGVTRTVWQVANYAAGWHKNSALPGEGDNIVLSAHHNVKGEVFRDILKLEPGSVVSLHGRDDETQYDYVISEKFIVRDLGEPLAVRQANARWIGPFDEERLTMITCWPYSGNSHRAIVIAKPLAKESD